MNIFATSPCPIESAKALDDKRVIKMILESTQMLCTALNEAAGYQTTPYKSTHKNHPCNVWVRQSIENWLWLFDHAMALCEEYSDRYGKIHKSSEVLYSIYKLCDMLPSRRLMELPNCARNSEKGIDYTSVKDTYMAYQLYLCDRWETDKRLPTWHGTA